MSDALVLRAARDDDAAGLIDLIDGCFAEYDGCVLDLDGIDSDMKAVETAYRAAGGKFWLLVDPRADSGADSGADSRIVASIGYAPSETIGAGAIELKKLYVCADYRRRGIATRMFNLVLEAAGEAQASAIDLWSDRRFIAAHAFYVHHGFRKLPETRDLHDPSNTTEFYFVRDL